MSASRHTYAVILHTNSREVGGECKVLCILSDNTYATGSRKVAQQNMEDLSALFPDSTYTVEQLR